MKLYVYLTDLKNYHDSKTTRMDSQEVDHAPAPKRQCVHNTNPASATTVHIGDCVNVMREHMTTDHVDLIVTSPPYNANKRHEDQQRWMTKDEYGDFTQRWMTEACRVLKPGHGMFVNIGYWSGSRGKRYFLPTLLIERAERCGLTLSGWINWVKDKNGLSQTRGCGWGDTYSTSPFFMNGSEPILYFRKAGRQRHRDNRHDEWMRMVREPWIMKPKNMNKTHDAVFPEELPRRCIVMCSLPGDLVVDPFAGTGTVARVCERLGRRCVLIDRNDAHLREFIDRPSP